MRLPCVQWKIAYRKSNSDDARYSLVENPWWGWAADPFLFDYEEKTYLFAELWDYRTGKGSLGYKILSERNSKWRVVIDETYHLSYPHIITIDDDIYMCPESNGSNSVYFYKCIQFPNVWEKQAPFITGKYCDTTFFKQQDSLFGFTCNYHEKPYKLLLFKLDNKGVVFSDNNPILEGGAMTRPGGEFFIRGEKLIRVSQDNTNYYGEALYFTEAKLNWPQFTEKVIKRVGVNDCKFWKDIGAIGVHTYNANRSYEVVDLKFYKISVINLICRVAARIKK